MKQAVIFFCVCLLLLVESCRKPDADLFVQQSANNSNNLIATKLNIILILGDDIGYEIPTYTGGQSYTTPNIDFMAAHGLQFTHCNSAPMCSPSRFMLLTGKYNFRNYFGNSWGDLGLDQKTMANMLHDAGYKTCVAGKWQLNNGDSAIKHFGFDKYCVTNPFKVQGNDDDVKLHLYKDPSIYQNAAYLPNSEVKGKYSEDMFFNYLSNFIDSNKTQPFFIYWAPNLCHKPFSPTPDDADFATWDPNRLPQDKDTIYFPSMVKYFDKNIGLLLSKLQASNLQQKTVILFIAGDNGTDWVINSLYKGKRVHGSKGSSIDAGIHVAFIAYMPRKILPGVNTDPIDFVDFLPTIARIAGLPQPKTYGTLDGLSFYLQLLGNVNINARKYGYCYYDANRHGPDTIREKIWSLDTTYKVYDGVNGLYNYVVDPNERKLITGSKRTAHEVQVQTNLQNYINSFGAH